MRLSSHVYTVQFSMQSMKHFLVDGFIQVLWKGVSMVRCPALEHSSGTLKSDDGGSDGEKELYSNPNRTGPTEMVTYTGTLGLVAETSRTNSTPPAYRTR